MNILFVCTGNTCRSPMAEAIMKARTNHHVKSAGISTVDGIPTSEGTVKALKSMELDFEGQSSQRINDQLVEWADLILTMTRQHKQVVATQYSHAFEKLFTLKEYVSDDADGKWQDLKKAYLNLEEKRMLVHEEHGHQQTEQQLRAFLREEQDEIERIERELPNYDIADPLGMDQQAYQETLDEINDAIETLIKKLSE